MLGDTTPIKLSNLIEEQREMTNLSLLPYPLPHAELLVARESGGDPTPCLRLQPLPAPIPSCVSSLRAVRFIFFLTFTGIILTTLDLETPLQFTKKDILITFSNNNI